METLPSPLQRRSLAFRPAGCTALRLQSACPLIRSATPAPPGLPTSLALQAPSRPPGGALRRATAYAAELGLLAAPRPTASDSPRIPEDRHFCLLRAASGTGFLRKSSRVAPPSIPPPLQSRSRNGMGDGPSNLLATIVEDFTTCPHSSHG